jgi:hypothetical protein
VWAPCCSGERISFSYLISEKYTTDSATLELLHKGKVKVVTTSLGAPNRLIPVHIRGKPPSYYILAGMVFTPVCVPYLRSEYGKEYDFDAPVKLLDKMMHTMADHRTQQVVVLGQVLASDITIGYEDIVNTQVCPKCTDKHPREHTHTYTQTPRQTHTRTLFTHMHSDTQRRRYISHSNREIPTQA